MNTRKTKKRKRKHSIGTSEDKEDDPIKQRSVAVKPPNFIYLYLLQQVRLSKQTLKS